MIFFLYGFSSFGLYSAGAEKKTLEKNRTFSSQSIKDLNNQSLMDSYLTSLNTKNLNLKQTNSQKSSPPQAKPPKLSSQKLSRKKSNPAKTRKAQDLKSPQPIIGYQISSSKKSALLEKMNLKKGDRILSVGAKKIKSSSDFYKNLHSALKKSGGFQIRFKRDNKELFLNYQSSLLGSGKYKLKVLNKKADRQIASSSQSSSLSKNSAQSPSPDKSSSPSQSPSAKASPKKTKSLVPEKYKAYMQRAYISRSNSFVYSQPNFDAPKLQSLPLGKLVLISRKIFLPPHSFGSFYRIFLFRERKLIGYVSEAEVIPEFMKKNGAYSPNPNYKKAKIYKARKQVLKIEEMEDIVPQSSQKQIQEETRKRLSLKTIYKKYIGVSLGYNPYLNFAGAQSYENMFLGLKFNAYSPIIPIDFNLDFYRYKASSDLLAGFPFIRSNNYSLFVNLGGLIEYTRFPPSNSFYTLDYGPIGAVSLMIPLNEKLILKIESKGDYKTRNRLFSLKLLSSIQFAF